MSDPEWATVAEPATEAAAQIVLGRLVCDGIPARMVSNVPVPGLGISFRVQVEVAFGARARELLSVSPVTEDELTHLALSSPPPDSD